MLDLNRDQRGMLADKLADVANLAIGALFFAQFLGDGPFSLFLGVFGVVSWLVLVGWALVVARGDKS